MKRTHFILLFLASCFFLLPGNISASPGEFLIGAGVYDITGPAAEVGMMGYSMVDQKTAGIHMRLRSRAYVIAEPAGGKRVAFVCADLGMIFQAVKQQVVEKLQNDPALGGLYTEQNVLLSATHTHSGPGGFSHYTTYDLSVLGFIEENFNVIVDGIYRSIKIAHTNLVPGKILIAGGDLDNCGWQRSYDAYMNNPASERALYAHNTDKTMTLLKLVSDTNQEIGVINWFAVHPTSVGNTNHLITGDNKGYAEYLFEKLKGTNYSAVNQRTFVAAFAQSNSGDVSPNIYWGYPDGTSDYDHMKIIGQRQFDKALQLYNSATEYLEGGIDYRHRHVNFDELPVDSQWTGGLTGITTCSAAIGFSQVAGSTEDGAGIDLAHEGMVWGGNSWPEFTLVPGLQECQGEKIILFPAGDAVPFPWVPEVLPLQIVRIGNLAIVAAPVEITTMAGRRLRDTVREQLGGLVDHVVITAPANAYCSYLTTREEYAVQHYEGGSNMFGPYSLNAFQQEFAAVAAALRDGAPLSAGPTPRDLRDDVINFQTGVVWDGKYLNQDFGDVEIDANASYSRGATVVVQFVGGHPKNNLMIQQTFLKVEKMKTGTVTECHEETVGCDTVTVCEDVPGLVFDKVVATDAAPETVYEWQREGTDRSNVIIRWTIPQDTAPGKYRIRHLGHWKNGWDGSINPYEGVSRIFTVQ
ncbi:MAG: neutral/alkaline ceramidase [Thermodesulfobacteriota bacterium]